MRTRDERLDRGGQTLADWHAFCCLFDDGSGDREYQHGLLVINETRDLPIHNCDNGADRNSSGHGTGSVHAHSPG